MPYLKSSSAMSATRLHRATCRLTQALQRDATKEQISEMPIEDRCSETADDHEDVQKIGRINLRDRGSTRR